MVTTVTFRFRSTLSVCPFIFFSSLFFYLFISLIHLASAPLPASFFSLSLVLYSNCFYLVEEIRGAFNFSRYFSHWCFSSSSTLSLTCGFVSTWTVVYIPSWTWPLPPKRTVIFLLIKTSQTWIFQTQSVASFQYITTIRSDIDSKNGFIGCLHVRRIRQQYPPSSLSRCPVYIWFNNRTGGEKKWINKRPCCWLIIGLLAIVFWSGLLPSTRDLTSSVTMLTCRNSFLVLENYMVVDVQVRNLSTCAIHVDSIEFVNKKKLNSVGYLVTTDWQGVIEGVTTSTWSTSPVSWSMKSALSRNHFTRDGSEENGKCVGVFIDDDTGRRGMDGERKKADRKWKCDVTRSAQRVFICWLCHWRFYLLVQHIGPAWRRGRRVAQLALYGCAPPEVDDGY